MLGRRRSVILQRSHIPIGEFGKSEPIQCGSFIVKLTISHLILMVAMSTKKHHSLIRQQYFVKINSWTLTSLSLTMILH
jgi:hypothetical protein